MINKRLNPNYFDNPDIDLYDDSDYDYLGYIILNDNDLYSLNDYSNTTADKCYPTSNELLYGHMPRNMAGKRVATVGSSGDQALNALYYGSRDITLIDGNPFTRAFVEYKIALMKNFNKNQFWNILGSKMFDWRIYRSISHDLPLTIRNFWDKIILEQDNRSISDSASSFNIYRKLIQEYALKTSSFYRYNYAYEKLQQILKNDDYKLHFVNADVFDFDKCLDGTYDYIFLSNIIHYVNYYSFITLIKDLRKHLNPEGKIQYAYNYNKKAHYNFLWEYHNPTKLKHEVKEFKDTYSYYISKEDEGKGY
ncbi:MAG: DUF3419 family protein [Clostridiales bacterium]|nr:DUF3419 family protein [Clostridiales bacterium]